MPILVKNDDIRSGGKAKAYHGRHRSQWVKGKIILFSNNCMLGGDKSTDFVSEQYLFWEANSVDLYMYIRVKECCEFCL